MTVAEMIEWLKSQNQNKIVKVFSLTEADEDDDYFRSRCSCSDPRVYVDYVDFDENCIEENNKNFIVLGTDRR